MHDGRNIRVSNLQRLCVNDGPGVRTTIFLKGCYLRCPWCCNPECIDYHSDSFYKKADCNINDKICSECELNNGIRNKTDCPLNVYERTFKDYTQKELFDIIIRDDYYFKNGGGVTFSGGEPLFQAGNIIDLLNNLHSSGIHIALETSLYAPHKDFCQISPLIDYWLVDLKFQMGFFPNGSISLEYDFKKNLLSLQKSNHYGSVKYRMVLMKEALCKTDMIIEKLKRYNICEIEFLPYHNLGSRKYIQLGKKKIEFGTVCTNDLDLLCNELRSKGINADYLSY